MSKTSDNNTIRCTHGHLYCRLGVLANPSHPLFENFPLTGPSAADGVTELELFYEPGLGDVFTSGEGYISPEASIAPGAQIAPTAIVGPGAEISAGAVIGAHAVIGADTYIGENMQLADNVFVGSGSYIDFAGKINSGVYLGENNTMISNIPGQLEIGKHSVVFQDNKLINVKKIGCRVVIGHENLISNQTELADDCRIGDYNTIFYAAIGEHTFIHNLCDIDRPSLIGARCKIFDGTRTRNGLCMRDGVEIFKVPHIEGAVDIGAGAKISHVDYIGFSAAIADGVSIENCGIIRDFDTVISSPPRLRRKMKFIPQEYLKEKPRVFETPAKGEKRSRE